MSATWAVDMDSLVQELVEAVPSQLSVPLQLSEVDTIFSSWRARQAVTVEGFEVIAGSVSDPLGDVAAMGADDGECFEVVAAPASYSLVNVVAEVAIPLRHFVSGGPSGGAPASVTRRDQGGGGLLPQPAMRSTTEPCVYVVTRVPLGSESHLGAYWLWSNVRRITGIARRVVPGYLVEEVADKDEAEACWEREGWELPLPWPKDLPWNYFPCVFKNRLMA